MKHQVASIARNQKSKKISIIKTTIRNVPMFLWNANWSISLIFADNQMLRPKELRNKFFTVNTHDNFYFFVFQFVFQIHCSETLEIV